MNFLTNWLQKRELQKVQHKSSVQAVALNSEEFFSRVQLNIREQQIEVANEVADLRRKIAMNDTDVQLRLIEVQKAHDDLEQVKAQFRIHLDNQRQDMDLKRDRFYSEQVREDKRLDYDHMYRMGQLQKEREQMHYSHQAEMAKIELQKGDQQREWQRMEADKVAKALEAMIAGYNLSGEQKHKERMRGMDVMLERFRMEIMTIRLLDEHLQKAAYESLRNRMGNFFSGATNGYGGGVYGEY